MSQYAIAVAVGSLRRESFNRKLANGVIKLAPSELSFKFLKIDDLPLSTRMTTTIRRSPCSG
jgi:chromate reductase, NAD(P)H dehydrogenase (quinone)